MRITLLVNYDPAAALALTYLANRLGKHQLTVFYTQKNAPSERPIALRQLADFEAGCLQPHARIFSRLQAECLNAINGKDLERFAASQPDLVLSIRHMSILKATAINVAKLGVINLHSGRLPAYQGVMATYWAMQNKEAQIGTTLHWIDNEKIDQGAIIAQTQQAIDYQHSYFWNACNLYAAGCAKMASAVDSLAQGESLTASPQSATGRYYTYPDRADLDAFAYPLWQASDSLDNWLN